MENKLRTFDPSVKIIFISLHHLSSMKRINDDPYWPDYAERLGPSDDSHTIPVLSDEDARRLGFTEDSEHVRSSIDESKHVHPPRPRGRPVKDYDDSFYAFVKVEGERDWYRLKFGIRRVPERETDKFIAWALRLHQDANEDRVREHLNKSQWLLLKHADFSTT